LIVFGQRFLGRTYRFWRHRLIKRAIKWPIAARSVANLPKIKKDGKGNNSNENMNFFVFDFPSAIPRADPIGELLTTACL
jgi:hypothetical protein